MSGKEFAPAHQKWYSGGPQQLVPHATTIHQTRRQLAARECGGDGRRWEHGNGNYAVRRRCNAWTHRKPICRAGCSGWPGARRSQSTLLALTTDAFSQSGGSSSGFNWTQKRRKAYRIRNLNLSQLEYKPRIPKMGNIFDLAGPSSFWKRMNQKKLNIMLSCSLEFMLIYIYYDIYSTLPFSYMPYAQFLSPKIHFLI